MGNIIQVDNVSLTIGNDEILSDININFESGKIHGIVGRNGSGKTMLIKCICGFVKPTKGSVIFNNKIIGKQIDFPEDVGIIIETPGFVPYYSGYRNLKVLSDINKKIKKEEILSVLKLVGLEKSANKQVKKYSLGMRQRLGIAQAIMENPSVLILDEPMNGLDAEGVEEFRNIFIDQKNKGKTILLVSHNKEDIEILCDDLVKMEHGKIIK